jgi:phosphoribosylcarboxyaminoimidazole (NCAIR) mutase
MPAAIGTDMNAGLHALRLLAAMHISILSDLSTESRMQEAA